MGLTFIDGNDAIAQGAILAGCRFFAGYPITPATSIYQNLLHLLPPQNGICLQAEDEIAAIGFCIGASMGGVKAMTATSGPGISLFSEHISFAIGSEVPLVIVDVQRLGPSTGSATKGADGDIQFLRWGNSGGLPTIVLAPIDAADCFVLTMHAFNLAEQYRCPVFIASNKEIGMTKESVDLSSLSTPSIRQRTPHKDETPYLPYSPDHDSKVPFSMPMGGNCLVRQTSSNHGADGYITVDKDILGRTLSRLQGKLMDNVSEFSFYEHDEVLDATTLVVCYGVTARAVKEAVVQLRKHNVAVSMLILKTLYPVPEEIICSEISKVKKIVVIEMNLGQYVIEIKRLAGLTRVVSYGQMDGELITPQTIIEVITS